jgi:hypothetical protein
MKKITALVAATAGIALFAPLSNAVGPKIEPGEWELTTTMETSMLPAPKVLTRVECIEKEKAEGDPLAALIRDANCTVLSQAEHDDSIAFEIECKGDPSMPIKSRGKGELTGDGKTLSGRIDTTTELPKMPDLPQVAGMPKMGGVVKTSQQWTGRFLGPCD